MKSLILIFFFLIFSTFSSLADKWTRYDETNSLVVYYDQKSWVKEGPVTYINLLYDLKKPLVGAEGTANSMIIYREFRCKEMKFLNKNTSFFEKKMAKGKNFYSDDKGELRSVSDYGSLDGSLFKAACQIK